MKPMRHDAGTRNRKKALHHAKCLLDELDYIDRGLRRLTDEHLRYVLGRAARLVNRLLAEIHKDNKDLGGQNK